MKFLYLISAFAAAILFVSGCSSKSQTINRGEISKTSVLQPATMRPYKIAGKTYYPTMVSTGDTFSGMASWYGSDFHGKKTSNGETYDMYQMTAAHKTFPMNTIVRVTNKRNNKSTVVRINDRGPFTQNRIIDLSYAAANALDMVKSGTAPVGVEVLGFDGNAKTALQQSVSKQKQSVVINDFDVQIGAFRKRSGAEIYKKMYNDKKDSYSAIIQEGIFGNEPIYRVFVRGFRGEEEARDFISMGEYEGAFIVRER